MFMQDSHVGFPTISQSICGFGFTSGKCFRPAPATKQGGVVAFGEATWGSWDSPFCCCWGPISVSWKETPQRPHTNKGRVRERVGAPRMSSENPFQAVVLDLLLRRHPLCCTSCLWYSTGGYPRIPLHEAPSTAPQARWSGEVFRKTPSAKPRRPGLLLSSPCDPQVITCAMRSAIVPV